MESSPVNWLCDPLPGYNEPPVAPLLPLGDPQILVDKNVRPSPLSKTVYQLFWKLNGFWGFYKSLTPEELEKLLRTVNVRLPGLYSPIISATLLLEHSHYTSTDWLSRATALVLAAQSFYEDLMKGRLEQDNIKGMPLEMGEYPNLFGTVLAVEGTHVTFLKNRDPKYLLVISNGWYYCVPLEKDFQKLRNILETCYLDSQNRKSALHNSIGWITAAENRIQFFAWKRLRKNPLFRAELEKINDIFLTLCLDSPVVPESDNDAARFIHIDNPGNRFYLSGTQLVVFANAVAGVIFNFTAYIDGNPMSRFANELYKRSEIQLEKNINGLKNYQQVENAKIKPLELKVPPVILTKTIRSVRRIIDGQQHTFQLTGFGRKAFGAYERDAVPLIVLALMAAIHKLTGRVPIVEQFVSMAHFRGMGLTRVKVTTPECREICELLNSSSSEEAATELTEKIRTCIRSQKHHVHRVRQYMPISLLETLYINSQSKIKRPWIFANILFRELLIKLTNHTLNPPVDILLSHPRILDGFRIFGRPGIRLPYVRQFGLHYLVYPDKLLLTFMPGVRWRIPNAIVVHELQKQLEKLIQFIQVLQEKRTIAK